MIRVLLFLVATIFYYCLYKLHYDTGFSLPCHGAIEEKQLTSHYRQKSCYCVIALLAHGDAPTSNSSSNNVEQKSSLMAVMVNDKAYPLKPGLLGIHILHCGIAPVANDGAYYYVKTHIDDNDNRNKSIALPLTIDEREHFVRRKGHRQQPSQHYGLKHSGCNDLLARLKRMRKYRQPTHDFYNRTQNKWPIHPLPQLYNPLSTIHRIKPATANMMDHGINYYADEIPTIYIIADPAEVHSMHEHRMEKIKVTARMFYISSSEIREFENIRLRVAGRVSRLIPKLSYDIKIRKQTDATLNGYRRLKLRAFGYDPSYIRENLAFRTLKSMGLPASSFSYVRVFINDQAIGFFGLIEAYSDSWPQNEFGYGENEYQQGILYQAKATPTIGVATQYISDLRYHNSSNNGDDNDNINHSKEYPYAQGQYKIKAKPSLGNASFIPFAGLTEFIARAPTDDSQQTIKEWQQHFEIESVLRSLALEIMVGFADGFISMADNYCLYQNGVDSTQFIFVPADLDSTFGMTFTPLSQMLNGNYTRYPGFQDRVFLTKVLQVRPFKDRFESLLKDMATRLINLDVMNETIDDLVTMIKQDVEWDQSLPRVHPGPIPRFCKPFFPNDKNSINTLGIRSTSVSATDAVNDIGDLVDDAMAAPIAVRSKNYFPNFPMDKDAVRDNCLILTTDGVNFTTAVNGPTGHISLAGVKEYVANSSRAIREFYNI